MKKRRNYKDLGEYKMPASMVNKVESMVAEADAEIEATRVNFRWGKEQLAVVKKAARFTGVPYQTFIKLVAYQASLGVIKDAKEVRQ